jgi:hypothetical protein
MATMANRNNYGIYNVRFDNEERPRARALRAPDGTFPSVQVVVETSATIEEVMTNRIPSPGKWVTCVVTAGSVSDKEIRVTPTAA